MLIGWGWPGEQVEIGVTIESISSDSDGSVVLQGRFDEDLFNHFLNMHAETEDGELISLRRSAFFDAGDFEVMFVAPHSGKMRARANRFRPPSWYDNTLHWLSRKFPGQDNQRWLREQIGPNSTPVFSEWFVVPPADVE